MLDAVQFIDHHQCDIRMLGLALTLHFLRVEKLVRHARQPLHARLDDMTRVNEAIDQALVEYILATRMQ